MSSPSQDSSGELLRIDIVVDGGNWYHSLREYLAGERRFIDYSALAEWVVNELLKEGGPLADRRVQIEKWYFAAVPGDEVVFSAALLAFLRRLAERDGYQVKKFPKRRSVVRCVKCGYSQTRYEEEQVDVAVATHMLLRAARKEVDVVVLVSGDSDYIPAIIPVKEMGVRVFVAGFQAISLSGELSGVASGTIDITEGVRACSRPQEALPQDALPLDDAGGDEDG